MYKIEKIKMLEIETKLNENYKKGWEFVCFISWFGKQSILSNYQQILFKKMKGG